MNFGRCFCLISSKDQTPEVPAFVHETCLPEIETSYFAPKEIFDDDIWKMVMLGKEDSCGGMCLGK